MKKQISILAAISALFLLFALSACGADTEPKDVKVDDVYSAIAAKVTLPDFITLDETAVTEYVSVNTADFKQMLVKISAESISADQIVCCEAVDSAAADRIEQAFSVYLEAVKKSFENYLPAEYAKMEKTEVKRSGNFIYYAVSSDESAINAVFGEYFS